MAGDTPVLLWKTRRRTRADPWRALDAPALRRIGDFPSGPEATWPFRHYGTAVGRSRRCRARSHRTIWWGGPSTRRIALQAFMAIGEWRYQVAPAPVWTGDFLGWRAQEIIAALSSGQAVLGAVECSADRSTAFHP